MRETKIGGTTRTIAANPFSQIAYERAFGPGRTLYDDINAFLGSERGPMTVLPLDALTRLEYAFEASVPGVLLPSFDAWVRALPMEALDHHAIQAADGWVTTLLAEVAAAFFPPRPRGDVGAAGTGGQEGAAP